MNLRASFISLGVKDLNAARAFYEKLGFVVFAGDSASHYLIMKNNNALIGLFQGMFEQNILTFNPGWDENAKTLEDFYDIRSIQAHLKKEGLKLEREVETENKTGPASVVLIDPDGNPVLIDQHI